MKLPRNDGTKWKKEKLVDTQVINDSLKRRQAKIDRMEQEYL